MRGGGSCPRRTTTSPAGARAPRRARSGGRRPPPCRSGTGGAAPRSARARRRTRGAGTRPSAPAPGPRGGGLGRADGGGGAVGAADRVLERHVAAVPRLAVVRLGLAHDRVGDAARVGEVEALG